MYEQDDEQDDGKREQDNALMLEEDSGVGSAGETQSGNEKKIHDHVEDSLYDREDSDYVGFE